MQTRIRHRDVRFEVVDDHLVRTVTGPDGRSYVHRCGHEAYRRVAFAFESCPPAGLTIVTLAPSLDLPNTQVNVALEFLKDRGCVVTRHRSNYPASDFVYEDALIEWHARAESGEEPGMPSEPSLPT